MRSRNQLPHFGWIVAAYLVTFFVPGLVERTLTIYPGPFSVSVLMLFALIFITPVVFLIGWVNTERQLSAAFVLAAACISHGVIGVVATPLAQFQILQSTMAESQTYETEEDLDLLRNPRTPPDLKVKAATALYQNYLRSSLILETRGGRVPFTTSWYWPVAAFAWALLFAFFAARLSSSSSSDAE